MGSAYNVYDVVIIVKVPKKISVASAGIHGRLLAYVHIRTDLFQKRTFRTLASTLLMAERAS